MPARFAYDCDSFNILVVPEEKAEVAPLLARFPTSEIFQLDQYPDLAGRKNILGLGSGQKSLEFGPGQQPAQGDLVNPVRDRMDEMVMLVPSFLRVPPFNGRAARLTESRAARPGS